MDLKDLQKPEKLYGMREASEAMGISYHTLFRMVRGGKIKARNVAKTGTKPIYGFAAEDIQAYYDHIQDSIKQHTRVAKKRRENDQPQGVHE